MDRVGRLRVVYWLALANVVVLCFWGVAFDVPGMVGSFAPKDPSAPPVELVADAFMAFGFLVGASLIGLLIWRPHGWGKLLLVFAGLSWIMHGAVIALLGMTATPPLHVAAPWVPIACGVAMFGLAIAHQLIDPSFFRARTA